MTCKNCGKELPEGSILCCFCGTPVEDVPEAETLQERTETAEAVTEDAPCPEYASEPAPKKKSNLLLIILACVAGVALLAVLVGAILYGMGINPVALLKPKANDILYSENYTVTDDVARENSDVVVATIGDKELTNGELQIYYWETVYNFLNDNYYYLSMYGLDYTQPLDQQACILAEGQTWQQYFLEIAISTWQRYNTLQMLAQEDGFQLDAEMQTFLDELPETMEKNAASYDYDSVQAWLEADCGPGVTQEGYLNYVSAYYIGSFYLNSLYEEMAPTDAETEAYMTENAEELAQLGISRDMGKYHDVRHILIAIEGGTTDEDGNVTYSDDDWEACLAKAQALLDEWKAGEATEASFAEFAKNYSADPGSSDNGGLYEDLTSSTSFIQEFKDWYLDETREPGDTGFVKNTQSSVQGYHIMYYAASEEMWPEYAAQELLTDRVSAMIDAGMAENPIEINYKKIVLGAMTI